ncbi:putative NBPF family member NBPF5 [Erethizon dorsatum]
MAVPLSPDEGAEMNVAELSEDVRCPMGERELQFEDRRSNAFRPEAPPCSLDNKVPKRGGVRYVNDAEERLHPEERELFSKLPLAKQLRLSMLLIREQERELSEVTKELKDDLEALIAHFQTLDARKTKIMETPCSPSSAR